MVERVEEGTNSTQRTWNGARIYRVPDERDGAAGRCLSRFKRSDVWISVCENDSDGQPLCLESFLERGDRAAAARAQIDNLPRVSFHQNPLEQGRHRLV